MKMNKEPISAIARAVGCSRSTIYREIKRNLHGADYHRYYTVTKAQSKANRRRRIPRKGSSLTQAEWRAVEYLIRKDLSPQQISNVLKREHGISISHESIYQHIYKDMRAGGTLYNHLRHRFRKARKRYRTKDRRGKLAGKRMIAERPEHINERKDIGHWEIDTVLGKGSRACLVTMVERKSRFVAIGRLTARTVECLNAKVIEMIKDMNIPVHTITSDNGTEFHGYKAIEEATGTVFYFANPHHSWERGTNENTNGLIRQYLPKGKSMRWVSQKACNQIAYKLNTRPRKIHDYWPPLKIILEAA